MSLPVAAAATAAAAFYLASGLGAQVDLRTTADEVLVDLVVRDNKGRIVRDLRPEEVEIVDDGQSRAVRSLRLIDGRVAVDAPGAGAVSATAAPKPRALHPLEEARLIVLAFESLDADPARIAREAALDLLKQPAGAARFAVVSVDTRMRLLEDFTADRQRLEAAVKLATSGTAMKIAAHSDQTRWRLENLVAAVPRDRPLEERVVESVEYFKGMRTASNSGVVPVYGQDAVRAVNAELLLRALEFDEGTAREITGRAVVESVLALSRGFAAVPGRKTLLLFTDGLYVPYYLDAKFRGAMSAANRTGLSVYPINTAGLGSSLENHQVRAEVAKAARISTQVSLSADLFLVNRDQVFALERGEEGLRANPNLALSELADATGGTLVANTNDLRPHLRRIYEDANTYYEVAYGPGISNYDGRYRPVTVKVSRPGVRVQSRSGYYALPPSVISEGLLPWEPQMLAAVNAATPPNDIQFRLDAIRLEPLAEGTKTAVVIEAPIRELRFRTDETANRFSARASIVALVKNEAGTVIRKLNFDLPLAGEMDKLARLQGGRLIWHERVLLPPGAHTIVAAVADREGTPRIGVQKISVAIPQPHKGVSSSQITLVRRIEDTGAAPDPENPFTISGARVTPTVTPELTGGRAAQITLLLIVYPDLKSAEPPQITVEYLRDGAVVDSEELEVPELAGRTRLPYLLTSTGRRPGEWQIRATVRQGERTVRETAAVRIVDSAE